MPKIQTLKPRVGALNTARGSTAQAPGSERIRGDTWMQVRRRIMLRDRYTCNQCGMVSLSNEVDHKHPLHLGGSNDDANLWVLCTECHKAKTAQESKQRALY